MSQIYYSPSKICHREGPVSNSGQDCGYPDINFYNPSKERKGSALKLNSIFQSLLSILCVESRAHSFFYLEGSEIFFSKIKQPWVKGNYSDHLMLCFRMSGATLPLPYMPSWLTEWHVYLYKYKDILCRCELVVRFSEAVWCFTIRDNIDSTNAVMRRIAICRLLAKGAWEWLWPLWRPTSVI